MEKSITFQDESEQNQDKVNLEVLKETLTEAKQDPAVKEALKKEKQPVSTDDLSPLQNNHEIGTSGGDQRASKTELNGTGETE